MDFSPAWERLQGMVDSLIASIPNLLVGLFILAVFYLIAQTIKAVVQRATEYRRRARNLALVLGRLAQGGVLIIGLLVAATIAIPDFTPSDLIGTLGIGSIAIGFAFRDIFQNFLAGILILLTEPFRINDQIVYKTYEGTVEDIQTRATTILTYDGRRVVIPNAELFTNSVIVNTAFDYRRLEYDIGIGYGDDIEQARAIILETLQHTVGVLPEPAPDVLVVQLAPSTVNIRVRWWIKPPRRADALDIQDRVLTAIKQSLMTQGIDLPFPTQQILFHDQTEATDGDRTRQREGWPPGRGAAPGPRSIADALRSIAEQQAARNGYQQPPHSGGDK